MTISERLNNKNHSVATIKAIATLTLTLMSTTAIATAPALADDYRFSPGSICQHSTSADVPKLVKGADYIFNSSTSYAYVTCPIEWGIPDDNDEDGGGPRIDVNVLKYNTQELTCTLRSGYGYGEYVDAKSVSTSATGYNSISTARVNRGIIYGIFCKLPPSSGIQSIYTWFD